jgi:hypothetical protein
MAMELRQHQTAGWIQILFIVTFSLHLHSGLEALVETRVGRFSLDIISVKTPCAYEEKDFKKLAFYFDPQRPCCPNQVQTTGGFCGYNIWRDTIVFWKWVWKSKRYQQVWPESPNCVKSVRSSIVPETLGVIIHPSIERDAGVTNVQRQRTNPPNNPFGRTGARICMQCREAKKGVW